MIDEFFDKEYWVVDFLPKQVPENNEGKYFSVERYYLEPSRYALLRARFAEILLKLYCYYDIQLFLGESTDAIENPEPDVLANYVTNNQHELRLSLIIADALITVGRDDMNMTVYGPSKALLEMIRTLAGAVGLFVWKP